jgi:hypothetical protein
VVGKYFSKAGNLFLPRNEPVDGDQFLGQNQRLLLRELGELGLNLIDANIQDIGRAIEGVHDRPVGDPSTVRARLVGANVGKAVVWQSRKEMLLKGSGSGFRKADVQHSLWGRR